MTKKELYKKVYECVSEDGKCDMGNIVLDEFFKDKVIIQRGENRHPYADILHEWVEDTNKVIQIDCGNTYEQWKDSSLLVHGDKTKLRIKPPQPPKPIYEWQYIILNGMDNENHLTSFYTDEEFKATRWKSQVVKIEETKRERKQ